MKAIKKYLIWSVLLSALIGLSGCGNSSSDVVTASDFSMTSDVVTASDFSMTLDVNESTVSADWKTLSSASDTFSASVVTQGSYGNFIVTDDTISYNKTIETNETDTGVLKISGGLDTMQITVTVHSLYWKQISEGEGHTSAIKSDGTLWSWGLNNDGQLGDGTTENSTVPVQESTGSTNWVSTSSGGNHTAAIKSDGTLWSWGSNAYGQLGDGTVTSSLVPVQEETEASDWISVRTGSGYSVGKKQNGEKRRWGRRNTVPIADDQSAVTEVNVAKAITLTGSDADNDPLTYTVVSDPINGTLTGTAPNLIYTPNTDYTGPDSFTFTVNDGSVDSAPATVSITVNDVVVNTPPVANDQSVVTDENVAKAITLTGSDADNDPLTYTVVSDPINGTLTGTAPNLIYTPYMDYYGSDNFTFIVNDGKEDSGVATVGITVNSVYASDDALAQIGLEADNPDVVDSTITVAQLNVILPALTNVIAANETAYQDYIDANPDLFSSPATQTEVQAMINTVNAEQDAIAASDAVLAQIGLEADNPDTVNSVVTVAQLNLILPILTNVTVANETAYQDYIDENPDHFSSPATQVEVQAMIDALTDVDVNIALNKIVTPLTNTVRGDPQNIVDGNLSNEWYSYEYKDGGYILSCIIDLEAIYTIERYRIYLSQTRRYVIESSVDGVNWTIQHDISGVDYYYPPIQDINVTSPYQMRYLRYWAINYDNAYTGLYEFEVYGELIP